MTYLDDADVKEQWQLNVEWVIFDVDGVLTDGSLWYTEAGEQIKRFHVRDGVAIKLLQDMGIDVIVLTAKDSSMVKQRMLELGVQHYYAGVKDKLSELVRLSALINKPVSQACYVGDDMVDVAAMQAAGVSVCPADAYHFVAEHVATIVAPIAGGQGVARWVGDQILLAKGLYEKAYQLSMTADFERKR